MFGMYSASIAAQTAEREQRRMEAIAERQYQEAKARLAARHAIDGRTFTCGPWSWRFVLYLPGNVERTR